MLRSVAIATLIFVEPHHAAQRPHPRALQGFQFGGTQQFGGGQQANNAATFSPAPTPQMSLSPWPTSETDDDDEEDFPTSSPWPTTSPYPTSSSPGNGNGSANGNDNSAFGQGNDMNPPNSTTLPPNPWAQTPDPNATAATPPGGSETSGTPVTMEPPLPGNETTTVVPPPNNVVATLTPTRAPIPTIAPTNLAYGNDDDKVPTISPEPTPPDGPDSGDYNSGSTASWNAWTHTNEPTHGYVEPSDDYLEKENDDKIKEEWEEKSNMEKAQAEWYEISHDKNVKIMSIVFGVTGFLLLIVVAHQLIENPDGFFGKLCRCLLACIRIICWPCRFLCCRGSMRARDRRTHQLVNSEPSSYGYSHDLELT